ncbi:GAF domain-containing sensor histidine kinase [Aeromicrobium halocynthiae]|uniref:Sensor-like histidine kinase SenX3 n=1 Tax=Aeromicrobium halocynthiae TaxID=560557 RepID=A0ABN2VZE3_9ACTN
MALAMHDAADDGDGALRHATADEAVMDYLAVVDDGDDDLDQLVRLVADVCDVPFAALNLIDPDQQHQVSPIGVQRSICARSDSMCALVLDEADVVVVPDASQDHRFAANAFVTGRLASVRFYASAPLTTSDGHTIGRLCVFDDVPRELTDRQRSALATLARGVMDVIELRRRTHDLAASLEGLRQAEAELRRSNEGLATFAGQVSHDLRNPLTAILATADLLGEEPAVRADDAVREMATSISEAGFRMARMIDEALKVAMADGKPRRESVDTAEVVRAAISDLQIVLDRTGSSIQVDDLPVVSGDADLLYSVLLNLLTNAVKFTRGEGPARVRVGAERGEHRWRLVVDDDGPGIAEDRRSSVFLLHERGEEDVEGHGIGLATVRRIVEAHGGGCGIDDSPLGGARVWIDLPD